MFQFSATLIQMLVVVVQNIHIVKRECDIFMSN